MTYTCPTCKGVGTVDGMLCDGCRGFGEVDQSRCMVMPPEPSLAQMEKELVRHGWEYLDGLIWMAPWEYPYRISTHEAWHKMRNTRMCQSITTGPAVMVN